uniref:PH domain-containing protein n=1 Tax=Panagrellus redivivus TaxID=6233 RepID=A0A7E4UVQ7_PANRE
MNHNRHVTKYGALQMKIRKKYATLLRKTKYVYEEEQWVALCVHNNTIPFLEWYPVCNEIQTHEPTKVRDLLECQFVNLSIGDDRCFVIGFNDENRPVIEFAARTSEDARSWIEEIQVCLRRIGCMPATDNEYQPMPCREAEKDSDTTSGSGSGNSLDVGTTTIEPPTISPSVMRRSPAAVSQRYYSLSEVIPMPSTTSSSSIPIPIPAGKCITTNNNHYFPDISPPSSPPASIRRESTSIATSPPRRSTKESMSPPVDEPPPKLPPRKVVIDLNSPIPLTPTSPKSTISTTTPIADGARSAGHQYSMPMTESSVSKQSDGIYRRAAPIEPYDLIPMANAKTAGSPDRAEASVYTRFVFPTNGSDKSISDESSRLSQEIAQLRMSTASSSTSTTTEDSNDSTKSYPGDHIYNQVIPPPRPPPKSSSTTLYSQGFSYAGASREESVPLKTVSILMTLCVEHLKLVEINGRIWVSGWSEEKNGALCHLLHFGDQIVEVNDTPVRSLSELPGIFLGARPGIPIPFKIRSTPHGQTYTLTKPKNVYTPRSFGIVLHKKKNRIEEVVPRSPAFLSGIPAKMSPFLYGRTEVSSVITEVNGIPLNPFAANDLFYKRMEQVPNGTDFQIVVQPKDFITLIKDQLKAGNKTMRRRMTTDNAT